MALVVAVVVLATDGDSGSDQTTIVKEVAGKEGLQAVEQEGVVLGGEAYGAPYGEGWGSERPAVISNGGASASGEMTDVRWDTWGGPVALGWGRLPIFKPNGGYYPELGQIRVKASDVGTCEGTRAYLQLSIRYPERPGGTLGPWQLWAGSDDVCEPRTGTASDDQADVDESVSGGESEASPEEEVIEDAALQGVDCGKLTSICLVTVKISGDGEWAALFRGPKPGHESEVQPDMSSFKRIEGYWQAFQIGNGGGCEVPEHIVTELGLDCF